MYVERVASSSPSSARFTGLRDGLLHRLILSLALFSAASVQAAGIVTGPALPLPAGVDAGEQLLAELNCVACHSADAAVTARLASRHAPVLSGAVPRLTPQFLRSFLAQPEVDKPGTTMPDLLHGLAATEKGEATETLTHFLVSLQGGYPSQPADAPAIAADPLKVAQGRTLYHTVGCVACHAPENVAGANARPDLQARSVPLGPLARKMSVEDLARFLINPLVSRPSGRMPASNLSASEANAIAIYLLREQAPGLTDPTRPPAKIRGLAYQYFEGNVNKTASLDALKPVSSGTVDTFSLSPRRRDGNIGLRYSGIVTVAAPGEYTFYSSSDDGTRLFVDGQLVADNDGIHPTTEVKGNVQLAAGDHSIQVDYFNAGGEVALKVSWKGPGFGKQEIPASALSHHGQPMRPVGEEPGFTVDAAKAARGRERFVQLGCSACHTLPDGGPSLARPVAPASLARLDVSRGCLADAPPAGAPRFALSPVQRQALRATLRNVAGLSRPLDDSGRVHQTLAAFSCLACHARDGLGGPGERLDYFTTVGELDLGDEGRVPPHLTKVGAKLRPAWMRDVLLNQGVARPYLATRMPQFGPANVGPLVAAFEQADGPSPADSPTEGIEAKHGRKLVGVGGLSCVACHKFGPYASLGIPAMDLTLMTQRLKKDWFRRYLLDPPSLRPGTRMPAFWPNGESANKDILGGQPDRQIDAIWAFLSRAREVGVPDGLIQGKAEIVATDEAVIYRNFIDGISRAIGVGYPEKANLCFDANELRLASLWHGPFLDAARHRAGRGEGFIGPLGFNVLRLPPGPSFARLADPQSPWPETTGKAGGFQLRGYTLDERRRPAFRYSLGQLQIDDFPVAVRGEPDAFFRRTVTLRGPDRTSLWFRAWVGARIESKPDGAYVADGKVQLKFSGAGQPVIRSNNGQMELLVPLPSGGNEGQFVEEIVW